MEVICERSKYFSQRDELRQYIDNEIDPPEFMDIQQVVLGDNIIKKTMDYFSTANEAAVGVMKMYYDYISPFLQIYKENINLSPLEDKIHLGLFQNLILKYQQQDVQLNVIEPRVEVGMFQIDATRLKELIKNCAHDCLLSLYSQIPDILMKKAQEYLSVIVDLNHKLNWTIHDSSNHFVEYFVNYNEYVAKANHI